MNAQRRQDMNSSATRSGHRHPAVESRRCEAVDSRVPYSREAGKRVAPLPRTARPPRRRSSSRADIRRERLHASRCDARLKGTNSSEHSYSYSYSYSSSEEEAGVKTIEEIKKKGTKFPTVVCKVQKISNFRTKTNKDLVKIDMTDGIEGFTMIMSPDMHSALKNIFTE